MKNTLYILLPLAVVSLIVGMVLKWGLNPRPVAVMKPSFFDEPAELGSVVYRRFFVELQDSPVVVWGADAQSTEHLEVVAGVLSWHPFCLRDRACYFKGYFPLSEKSIGRHRPRTKTPLPRAVQSGG